LASIVFLLHVGAGRRDCSGLRAAESLYHLLGESSTKERTATMIAEKETIIAACKPAKDDNKPPLTGKNRIPILLKSKRSYHLNE
jgi:hypothetical protein